jgi:hypothetical protein
MLITDNLTRCTFEEACLLAKEKYDNRLPMALNISYSRLRSAGDTTIASVVYELSQKLDSERER